MAINIGNVNFGIDANTSGLRRSISQLAQFSRRTNAVAKSQIENANKLVAARTRQESATKKAFQATLRLNAAVKRGAGAAQGENISRNVRAFQALTQTMTSGVLTTRQFTEAQDAFATKINRTSRALAELNAKAKSDKMNSLNTVMRNLESSAVLAVGPLSGIGARIRSLGAIAGRSSLLLVGLFAGITAGIVVLSKLAASAVQASRVFESSMARFEAASGSIKIARKEMAFVIETANKLGLRIDTSARAFSRLAASARGTSLEGEGARKVFLAVSKAAAALRLGAGEVEGTFRAIEQIMSKGTVQAEELRGQLGERLPGAFRIAADSMGVTTAKLGEMLKAGELLGDEFLIPFAEALEEAFGLKALDNVNSFQGAMNLLSNQGLLFSRAFDRVSGASVIFIGAIKVLTRSIAFLRKNLNLIIGLLAGTAAAFLVMTGPAIIGGLIALVKMIRIATVAQILFNIAVAANPFGAAAIVILKVIAALAALAAVTFFVKKKLDESGDSADDMNSILEELKANAAGTGKMSQGFKDLNTEIAEAAAELRIYAQVLAAVGASGTDEIDALIRKFTALAKVQALTALELGALTQALMDAGEFMIPMANDADNLARIITNLMERLLGLKDAADKLKTSGDAIRDAMSSIVELELRFQAIGRGREALDAFDNITVAVRAFGDALFEGGVLIEDRIRLEALFRAALIKTTNAEIALDASEKAIAKAQKLADAARKRAIAGMTRAKNRIDQLRASNKALASGPESFEVFTKVEQPLLRMEAALRKAGISGTELNKTLAIYKELLEEQLKLTDRFARASEQMAAAVVNAFEDIIIKGGSVKDMLKDLARELFRVILRATFLDPLLSALSGSFNLGGLFKTGGVAGAGAGAGDILTTAHGGTGVIGGSGSKDRPVTFFGRPGEVVDVSTPGGGRGGGGGGGPTIMISAPGADAGTVARIKEIVRVEMVPQIIEASSATTVSRLRRPKFA